LHIKIAGTSQHLQIHQDVSDLDWNERFFYDSFFSMG